MHLLSVHILILSWASGIWYATFQPSWGLGAVVACFSVMLILKRSKRIVWAATLFSFWLGSSHLTSWRNSHREYLPLPQALTFTGTLRSPPDERLDSTYLIISPDPPRTGESTPTAKVRLTVPRFPRYSHGDRLTVTGTLKKPEVFESFNYPLYLESFGVGSLMSQPELTLVGRSPPVLGHYFIKVRLFLEKRINLALPEPESSLLAGILLGSRRAIPESVQEDLKATGTSHIVAISGANVTIVLTALISLLPLYSRKSQQRATVVAGISVALLTGASARVVRGAVAAILIQTIRLVRRPGNQFSLVLVPAALMVAMNPLYLTADSGFQLSFAAYSGLVFMSPYLTKGYTWLQSKIRLLRALPEFFSGIFLETLAASLGTLPLLIRQPDGVAVIGLLVNPLVLWLVPFITASGAIVLLVPFVLTSAVAWSLAHFLLTIIHFFAKA